LLIVMGPRQARVDGVLPERLLQQRAAASEARADGADRYVDGVGYLLVRQPLHVGHDDDDAEYLGKGVDRPLEVLTQQPVEELLLSVAPPEEEGLMQSLEDRE
jgi:hypothetical protein